MTAADLAEVISPGNRQTAAAVAEDFQAMGAEVADQAPVDYLLWLVTAPPRNSTAPAAAIAAPATPPDGDRKANGPEDEHSIEPADELDISDI